MFCHICASKAVFDSQLDILNQKWDSKKMEINTQIKVKYNPHTWDIETCSHQNKKEIK